MLNSVGTLLNELYHKNAWLLDISERLIAARLVTDWLKSGLRKKGSGLLTFCTEETYILGWIKSCFQPYNASIQYLYMYLLFSWYYWSD